ncbi:hypothetical protein V495_03934 [Pseudogymnoascus sp. VKM F-4514 (FW-929)]|nr:hypothetical protein V495_03934 [Pseudogymnoascus sp. VKM F-4514 (FW-929)]KFY58758.1 hypothetical protein V497_04678 [Pseudogymnoascus sp. VKM F-4516 (FW-969)]
MKLPSLVSRAAGEQLRLSQLCLALASFTQLSQAITFNPIPSPNLDLSQFGRVGIAGDFDGISLYQYEGQSQLGSSSNGDESVLARFPDGGFASVASSDASIQAMCPFVSKDGSVSNVVVAGNFTSLGGVESPGIALFNPNTSTVTPVPGLSGQVSALYCDKASNTVYIGGKFKAANSTNAAALNSTLGLTDLPFLGFNGPVTSITKSSAGKIIFGGSFTGLGNATVISDPDQQIINIAKAKITSGPPSTNADFADPKNIVCKDGGKDGPGDTFLLADTAGGFWRADFGFGFQPTKLRLWNTHLDGRGTKTWRYTAFPIAGIMNFTYVDPATGANASCSSECPLSNDPNVPFQDFVFVNNVGMNSFQIDITEWYGSGAGLTGLKLFEDDIYSYAINDFNEPVCAVSSTTASKATVAGPWEVTPSRQSVSNYLTLKVDGSKASSNSESVVFFPHIKESGNYSVNIYTPGCIQDDSCATRGQVRVTGTMGAGSTEPAFETDIFQTNNFDKYDQIYIGFIDAGSDSFRPSIKLAVSSGQSGQVTAVANRVGFTLLDSAGGLNSLFEFDPAKKSIDGSAFAKSAIDKAGSALSIGADIKALVTSGDITIAGGNYSAKGMNNIFGVNKTSSFSLTGDGLNGAVYTMFVNNSIAYIGGDFDNTSKANTKGLNHVAAYDVSKDTWNTLGAGVNGRVSEIVPFAVNFTNGALETVLSLSGNFDEINAFGANKSIPVSGFAIWVPSRGNWLQNLKATQMSFDGKLTTTVDLPNGAGSLFSGSLSSSQIGAHGAAALTDGEISSFPVDIEAKPQSSSSISKRATSANNTFSGVVTGHFYEAGDINVTVFGGHFAAKATDGTTINNLLILDGANSDTVTGLSQIKSNSTVMALATNDDVLWIGGALSGTANSASINGLLSYNLKTKTTPIQPPALAGDDVVVSAISIRESTGDIYVAGSFDHAGSLDCPGLCVFTAAAAQWNRPGTISGTVNTIAWQSPDYLIAGGALVVAGNKTALATYDAKSQVWKEFDGGSSIPGAITALTPASKDASQFWVSGVATNGSAFLMKYDGEKWSSIGYTLGSKSEIRGIQILPLSEDHTSTDLVPSNHALLLTGSLNLPSFGNASAVLFNGTTFQPYALTSTSDKRSGSISKIFSQQQNVFEDGKKHLALGLIVLIGLAIALALIFFLVVAGIIAERIRRKREGYVPAPTNMFDKTSQMSRLPPEQIFGTLGKNRGSGAPAI